MKKKISAILALVLATACFPLQTSVKACDMLPNCNLDYPDCVCDLLGYPDCVCDLVDDYPDVNWNEWFAWEEDAEELRHREKYEVDTDLITDEEELQRINEYLATLEPEPFSPPRKYTYAEYEELKAAGRVLSDGLNVMTSGTDWTKELYSVWIIDDEGNEDLIIVKSKWYIEDDEEVDIEEIANKSDKTEKDVITGLFGVVDGVLNGEITDEEALQLTNKILKGDATEDGEVDIVDVISVNKSILGQTKLSSSAQKASDIDEDGIVSPSDSLAIMQYIVGLTKEL